MEGTSLDVWAEATALHQTGNARISNDIVATRGHTSCLDIHARSLISTWKRLFLVDKDRNSSLEIRFDIGPRSCFLEDSESSKLAQIESSLELMTPLIPVGVRIPFGEATQYRFPH